LACWFTIEFDDMDEGFITGEEAVTAGEQ